MDSVWKILKKTFGCNVGLSDRAGVNWRPRVKYRVVRGHGWRAAPSCITET